MAYYTSNHHGYPWRNFVNIGTSVCGVDKHLLWAVAALCFFGFFRIGELLIASGSDEGERPLILDYCGGDVAIDSASTPNYAESFPSSVQM